MAAHAVPDRRGRYPWTGANEAAVGLACARVARHLARAGVRRVGVLPVGRHGLTGRMDLSPLLERIARASKMFGGGVAAFIGPWVEWGARAPAGERGAVYTREVEPDVLEVVPRSCEDAASAAAALAPAMSSLPDSVESILVDLGGYGPMESAHIVHEALDGLLVAVRAKDARTAGVVASLQDTMQPEKRLGAILIG